MKKSTGLDGITTRFLKISADIITPSITEILNLSIISNSFPQCWKESKVIPLHKSGPTNQAENDRPSSILPILSKILERHVHDTLYHFIQKLIISYVRINPVSALSTPALLH